MSGRLFLIPTVIALEANDTIPKQVLEIFQEIDVFLVENVRTARRYISSLKLGLTIEELSFIVLDKKTTAQQLESMMKPLANGGSFGVLSESGCPGVADPGSAAVAWAHKNDVQVIPLVGPSSVLLALMASGFNGQNFAFHGYLPIDKKDLALEIRNYEQESRKRNQTQIFIETPYRNNQLLETLLNSCRGNTIICVAKDLNGPNETVLTRSVNAWKNTEIDLHKVPTVFLLYSGV